MSSGPSVSAVVLRSAVAPSRGRRLRAARGVGAAAAGCAPGADLRRAYVAAKVLRGGESRRCRVRPRGGAPVAHPHVRHRWAGSAEDDVCRSSCLGPRRLGARPARDPGPPAATCASAGPAARRLPRSTPRPRARRRQAAEPAARARAARPIACCWPTSGSRPAPPRRGPVGRRHSYRPSGSRVRRRTRARTSTRGLVGASSAGGPSPQLTLSDSMNRAEAGAAGRAPRLRCAGSAKSPRRTEPPGADDAEQPQRVRLG
jgi:hypothetical protein